MYDGPVSGEPVTLDQLSVFLAVVDSGSFSGAARKLSRAQSAISYAIANLERLLELELFDRTGRKPVLTAAGRALLDEARTVNLQVDRLLARAQQMREGVEPRLSLAVDVFFPMTTLLEVLAAFRREYPSVPLLLRTEALGAVAQLVADEAVQIGLSEPLDTFPAGIERSPLTTIDLVTVCAPTHPLARSDQALALSELREHTQLVLTDRSSLTKGQQHSVAGEDNWRLADLPTKLACLSAGFGWGNMPLHMVEAPLAAGQLVRLDVREWGPAPYAVPLFVIHRSSAPPGPAGRWLISALEARLGEV